MPTCCVACWDTGSHVVRCTLCLPVAAALFFALLCIVFYVEKRRDEEGDLKKKKAKPTGID